MMFSFVEFQNQIFEFNENVYEGGWCSKKYAGIRRNHN